MPNAFDDAFDAVPSQAATATALGEQRPAAPHAFDDSYDGPPQEKPAPPTFTHAFDDEDVPRAEGRDAFIESAQKYARRKIVNDALGGAAELHDVNSRVRSSVASGVPGNQSTGFSSDDPITGSTYQAYQNWLGKQYPQEAFNGFVPVNADPDVEEGRRLRFVVNRVPDAVGKYQAAVKDYLSGAVPQKEYATTRDQKADEAAQAFVASPEGQQLKAQLPPDQFGRVVQARVADLLAARGYGTRGMKLSQYGEVDPKFQASMAGMEPGAGAGAAYSAMRGAYKRTGAIVGGVERGIGDVLSGPNLIGIGANMLTGGRAAQAGQAMREMADDANPDKTLPPTSAEQSNRVTLDKLAGYAGGAVPDVAAALATGGESVPFTAGAAAYQETYKSVYEDAIKRGMEPLEAEAYAKKTAALSATANAALMRVSPMQRVGRAGGGGIVGGAVKGAVEGSAVGALGSQIDPVSKAATGYQGLDGAEMATAAKQSLLPGAVQGAVAGAVHGGQRAAEVHAQARAVMQQLLSGGEGGDGGTGAGGGAGAGSDVVEGSATDRTTGGKPNLPAFLQEPAPKALPTKVLPESASQWSYADLKSWGRVNGFDTTGAANKKSLFQSLRSQVQDTATAGKAEPSAEQRDLGPDATRDLSAPPPKPAPQAPQAPQAPASAEPKAQPFGLNDVPETVETPEQGRWLVEAMRRYTDPKTNGLNSKKLIADVNAGRFPRPPAQPETSSGSQENQSRRVSGAQPQGQGADAGEPLDAGRLPARPVDEGQGPAADRPGRRQPLGRSAGHGEPAADQRSAGDGADQAQPQVGDEGEGAARVRQAQDQPENERLGQLLKDHDARLVEPAKLSKDQAEARRVGEAFGKRVKFYESEEGRHALVDPENPDTLYLHRDLRGPAVVREALGHELAHSLARSDPDAIADFVSQLKPGDVSEASRAYLERAKQSLPLASRLELLRNPQRVEEEGIATLIGDAMKRDRVWRDVAGRVHPATLGGLRDAVSAIADKLGGKSKVVEGVRDLLTKLKGGGGESAAEKPGGVVSRVPAAETDTRPASKLASGKVFNANDLRARLKERYEQAGGGVPIEAERLRGTLMNPYTFLKGGKYEGEVRNRLAGEGGKEGIALSTRGVTFTRNPSQAGGEDAIAAFRDHFGDKGEDLYWQMVREKAGLTWQDARNWALKSANDDPYAHLLAQIHDRLPVRGEKDTAKELVKPEEMPAGTKFKWRGYDFEIVEDEDGFRTLRDGGDFDPVPADAIPVLPADKGTVQSDEGEALPEGEFAPGDEKKQGFYQSSLDEKENRGVFGQYEVLKDTGAQQKMAYETDRKSADLPDSVKDAQRNAESDQETDPLFLPAAAQKTAEWLTDEKNPVGEFIGKPIVNTARKLAGSLSTIRRMFNPGNTAMGHEAKGVLRENMARSANEYAQADAFLKDLRGKFAKTDLTGLADFADRIERGIPQATAEGRTLAAFNKQLFDWVEQQAAAHGVDTSHWLENYFPRMFKDPKAAAAFFADRFGGSNFEGRKGFLKPRSFKYFVDAIQHGLEPISNNPVDLILNKFAENVTFLGARRSMSEMVSKGMLNYFEAGATRPEGWSKLNDTAFTIYGRGQAQFATKAVAPDLADAAGGPDSGVKVRERGQLTAKSTRPVQVNGYLAAPDSVAEVINNVVTPSLLTGSGAFSFMRYLNNRMTQAKLSLSGFHATKVTKESINLDMARALDLSLHGELGEAAKSVANLPAMLQGRRVRDVMLDPRNATPEEKQVAEAMIRGGFRANPDSDYNTTAASKFADAIRQGGASGWTKAGLRFPFASAEKATDMIFKQIVQPTKLAHGYRMTQDALRRLGPNATPEAIRSEVGKISDHVDNVLGLMVKDNLMWNRTASDVAHLMTLSVGWNYGSMRALLGGVKDLATAPIKAYNGESIDTRRMSYLASTAGLQAMGGALATYLATGHGPKSLMDYLYPPSGKKDNRGREIRLNLGLYTNDYYGFLTSPMDTAVNKASPLMHYLGTMIRNQNYQGTQIRPPIRTWADVPKAGIAAMEELAKQFIPFSVRGMQDMAGGTGKAGKLGLLPYAGIMPARAGLSMTAAEQRAAELRGDNQPRGGRTQAQVDKTTLRYQLADQLKSKDPAYAQNLHEAIKTGKLSFADRKSIAELSRLTPSQRMIHGLPFDQAMEVFGLGNDEEKRALLPTLTREMLQSRSMSLKEKSAARAQLAAERSRLGKTSAP